MIIALNLKSRTGIQAQSGDISNTVTQTYPERNISHRDIQYFSF